MAKRKNMSITETIAQHLETTAEMPEVVGVPEEKFQSVFEKKEEEKVVKEEPKKEKPKKEKIQQPLSPHHIDSLTSEINTNLNSIF